MLTNAALSAALNPDSGAGGISLEASRDNAPAAGNALFSMCRCCYR